MALFDTDAITAELDRHYRDAERNGLPPAARRGYASGALHEQLARVVRRWQDQKTDEAAQPETAESRIADAIDGWEIARNRITAIRLEKERLDEEERELQKTLAEQRHPGTIYDLATEIADDHGVDPEHVADCLTREVAPTEGLPKTPEAETDDPERCPGCGRGPGDDIAPAEECNHEDGCGYWREHGND